jgi:hypothetical protein
LKPCWPKGRYFMEEKEVKKSDSSGLWQSGRVFDASAPGWFSSSRRR